MFTFRECLKQLSPYSPGKPIDDVKREFGLSEVIKLASNENPLGCSPSVREAVIRALDNPQLYPDGNCTLLREALAKKYQVSPGSLFFGGGTDDVIFCIARAFINPGDECVTAEVTFSQYAAGVLSMDGRMVYAPMKNNGLDLDAIAGLITPKTKLIALANPNNPTGTLFTAAEQEAFLAKVPPHILVILDEAYGEFVTEDDFPDTLSMMARYPNLVWLKTFSKVYGLASFRVGYGIAHEEVISAMERIRNPFNVSAQAQAAALAALADEGFIARSLENNRLMREYCYDRLSAMKLSYIPTQANFIMVELGMDSREVFQALLRKGYIVRAGAPLGMEGYMRLTIGTKDQMEGFFKALEEVLAERNLA